jgi:hypothetical protein
MRLARTPTTEATPTSAGQAPSLQEKDLAAAACTAGMQFNCMTSGLLSILARALGFLSTIGEAVGKVEVPSRTQVLCRVCVAVAVYVDQWAATMCCRWLAVCVACHVACHAMTVAERCEGLCEVVSQSG